MKIAIVATALLIALPASAQRYCYSLGDDMLQCTDGTTAFSLGQGAAIILDPPVIAPVPDYVVPQASRRYLPPAVLSIPELIAEHQQAVIDCRTNVPNSNCVARWNKAEAELAARDMCWGRAGQANSDSSWQRCGR